VRAVWFGGYLALVGCVPGIVVVGTIVGDLHIIFVDGRSAL